MADGDITFSLLNGTFSFENENEKELLRKENTNVETMLDSGVCSENEIINEVQKAMCIDLLNENSDALCDLGQIVQNTQGEGFMEEIKINANLEKTDSNAPIELFANDHQINDENTEKLIDFSVIEGSGHGEYFTDFSKLKNEVSFKEEEFHDAAQFFKDPSSITFLENAGASNIVESEHARSSLYIKFDPLHEKFSKHLNMNNKLDKVVETFVECESNLDHAEKNELPSEEKIENEMAAEEKIGNEIASEGKSGNENSEEKSGNEIPSKEKNGNEIPSEEKNENETASEEKNENEIPSEEKKISEEVKMNDNDTLFQHLRDSKTRESVGNMLISFDSPIIKNQMQHLQETNRYSEEELQQCLKTQELSLQEVFLKRQCELKQEIDKKQEEMKIRESNLVKLYTVQQQCIMELVEISSKNSEKLKILQSEKRSIETENDQLKQDLKVSTAEFQNWERTFSDLHKRYEQSKSMLKVYKDNEDCLKQEVISVQGELREKEKMYDMLQSRTEDMLQKANVEVESVKKTCEAQVAVLKAQLKKAELKISSLESDYKQVKIENSKLGSICDDLMARVSNT